MLQRRSSLDLSHDRQVWTMSACLYSSHTLCLCMIGGVTKLLWTQPGSTCSRQKPDLSTPFHQPELQCCSMQYEQHTRVAMYGVRDPDLPSPESWGWSKNPTRGWEPMWTLLPEAAVSCSELLKCGCKKGCRGLCKCVKANLKCTSLCHCCGNCEHSDHY